MHSGRSQNMDTFLLLLIGRANTTIQTRRYPGRPGSFFSCHPNSVLTPSTTCFPSRHFPHIHCLLTLQDPCVCLRKNRKKRGRWLPSVFLTVSRSRSLTLSSSNLAKLAPGLRRRRFVAVVAVLHCRVIARQRVAGCWSRIGVSHETTCTASRKNLDGFKERCFTVYSYTPEYPTMG